MVDTFGLTPTGFVPMTQADVEEEIDAALRATFGLSINTTTGLLGRIKTIFAERIALVWELGEDIASSQDPDGAAGPALDALAALTGSLREEARSSTVTLTLTGAAATVVPVGNQVSTTSTEQRFETDEEATLVALTAWASTTAYVVGDRRSNASRAYICTDAGTSAGSGGPTVTGEDIVDGTVEWLYMGEGAAADDVEAFAVETGVVTASAYDITTIETAIVGWQGVINLLDAEPGAPIETDAVFRVRREDELARTGAATVDAIRVDVLDVDGVTTCTVFDNPSDSTNGDGMPPHSVEVLVQGGDDQDIADAILAVIAGGPASYGTTTMTSYDSAGNAHTIKFTRPSLVEIYVTVVIEVADDDSDDYPEEPEYPSDGDDQVADAVVAFGDTFEVSRNVVSTQIGARLNGSDGVDGVVDVVAVFIAKLAPEIASVAHGTDTFTKTAHAMVTGDGPFRMRTTVALPTEIGEQTDYWVIRMTDDTFKLAETRTLALAGTPYNITDNGTGTHSIHSTARVVIGSRELATFDTSRVVVDTTPVDEIS